MKTLLLRLFVLVVSAVFGGRLYAAEVVNEGRAGDNTVDLINRWNADYVLRHDPELVVMLVGANDVLNSQKLVPLDQYETNLITLATNIINSGSELIMMTVLPCVEEYVLSRHDPAVYEPEGPNGKVLLANAIVERVAANTGAALIDLHSLFDGKVHTNANSLIRNVANSGADDGIHPTAEGYGVIAGAVHDAIIENNLPVGKIVCYGDSITYGVHVAGEGTATGDTYPGQLNALLNTPSGWMVINDGFENDTAASDFADDADPAAAGWSVNESFPASILVFSTNTTDASSSWVHGGANAVRLRASGANGMSRFFAGSAEVVLSFWVYAPAGMGQGGSGSLDTLRVNLRNTTGNDVGPNLRFFGGNIEYHDGAAWSSITAYATDRYAQVKVIASGASKTFKLEYDGTLYDNGGSGYNFYGNVGLLAQVFFSFEQDYREVYIDDVSVTCYDLQPPSGLLIILN